MLSDKRPLTLFAPTNDAFAKLSNVDDILSNKTDMREVRAELRVFLISDAVYIYSIIILLLLFKLLMSF